MQPASTKNPNPNPNHQHNHHSHHHHHCTHNPLFPHLHIPVYFCPHHNHYHLPVHLHHHHHQQHHQHQHQCHIHLHAAQHPCNISLPSLNPPSFPLPHYQTSSYQASPGKELNYAAGSGPESLSLELAGSNILEDNEEEEEEDVFVLTDEWAEFFAKSEAKRQLAKQNKKKGKK